MLLAIDPGPEESAFAVLDTSLKPVNFGRLPNYIALEEINSWIIKDMPDVKHFAIEMVASYGMAVGKEVFETVFWIGRFWERADFPNKKLIYRKEEKMNLCGNMRAKDSNIRQALIDRFGPVGTKKKPGWFYGVSKDVWAAVACGVTYYDLYLQGMDELKRREA